MGRRGITFLSMKLLRYGDPGHERPALQLAGAGRVGDVVELGIDGLGSARQRVAYSEVR